MAARRTLLWAALVASCLGPGSMLAQPAAALRAAPARRSWTPAAGGVRMMVSLPSPTTKPKDGGVGVLEREVTPKRDPLAKTVGDASVNDGMFQVLLFNDEVNTREYVARCLVVVCGLSEGDAFSCMQKAHSDGYAVVGVWGSEVAEMYTEMLKAKGLEADMSEA